MQRAALSAAAAVLFGAVALAVGVRTEERGAPGLQLTLVGFPASGRALFREALDGAAMNVSRCRHVDVWYDVAPSGDQRFAWLLRTPEGRECATLNQSKALPQMAPADWREAAQAGGRAVLRVDYLWGK